MEYIDKKIVSDYVYLLISKLFLKYFERLSSWELAMPPLLCNFQNFSQQSNNGARELWINYFAGRVSFESVSGTNNKYRSLVDVEFLFAFIVPGQ